MRYATEIECFVQLFDRADLARWQIALVVLHHERNGARIETLIREVRMQILETLDILGELTRLTVGDKDDAVDSLQYQLARSGVVHLTRHCVQLEARSETRNRAQIKRQKIEKQRAIGLGGERDHLALSLLGQLRVDVLKISRLARSSGTVIDDLARDLAGAVVDDGHPYLFPIGPKSASRLRLSSPSKSPDGMGIDAWRSGRSFSSACWNSPK